MYDDEAAGPREAPLERRRRGAADAALLEAERRSDAVLRVRERPALRNALTPASKNYFRECFDAA